MDVLNSSEHQREQKYALKHFVSFLSCLLRLANFYVGIGLYFQLPACWGEVFGIPLHAPDAVSHSIVCNWFNYASGPSVEGDERSLRSWESVIEACISFDIRSPRLLTWWTEFVNCTAEQFISSRWQESCSCVVWSVLGVPSHTYFDLQHNFIHLVDSFESEGASLRGNKEISKGPRRLSRQPFLWK